MKSRICGLRFAYHGDFALRVDHVKQIHLAGYTDEGDMLIDTHSARVSDPVWELYRRARRADVPVLLEWDDDLPSWSELVLEARRAA